MYEKKSEPRGGAGLVAMHRGAGVLTERPKFPLIEAENALKKTSVESLRVVD